MTWYIGKRLAMIVPVLLGVSLLVFSMMHMIPGDVATALAGPAASEAVKEVIRHSLGLDQPLPVQFWNWISNIVAGDFGSSLVYKRPISEFVFQKFFNTALLAGVSALLAISVGMVVGIFVSSKSHSLLDRITMAVTLVLGSTPLFWFGLIMVLLFSLNLRWFPATGMVSIVGGGGFLDIAHHLVLPAIVTAVPSAAIIARMTRASMLEVLGQNYIRVARAKGIRRRIVLRRHALRNALPPISTVCGLELGYLLSGVVFVEVVFAWPGLGNALYYAIIARDIPTVQASVLLIALSFVMINLIVDVYNAFLDPKIRVATEGGQA
jgi:peptide/nickel transport system permease protein